MISDFYWIIYISALVITAFFAFIIWKIEKKKRAHRRNAKRSHTNLAIDQTEINLYGL
jgi:hypothetical protein